MFFKINENTIININENVSEIRCNGSSLIVCYFDKPSDIYRCDDTKKIFDEISKKLLTNN